MFAIVSLYRAQLELMGCLDHQVMMGYQELKGGLEKMWVILIIILLITDLVVFILHVRS